MDVLPYPPLVRSEGNPGNPIADPNIDEDPVDILPYTLLTSSEGNPGNPIADVNIKKDFVDVLPHTSPDYKIHYTTSADYYVIPSNPISIYYTGEPWTRSTSFEGYDVPKETRPVYDDAFTLVWRELGQRVYQHLDSVNVQWTSIDPVHFLEQGKEPSPFSFG